MESTTKLMDCPECGQTFVLIEYNPDGCGWETEKFKCPHEGCNYSSSRKSSGYFDTRKPQNNVQETEIFSDECYAILNQLTDITN